MDLCMQMPGGGPFNLARGQPTDDSELAMCSLAGLVAANAGKKDNEEMVFSNDKIAAEYLRWR